MNDKQRHIIDFYARHPISAAYILAKLRNDRGELVDVHPDELYAHDQDHYGGLEANDALAERAGMATGKIVVDFCAGLGGPARYWAHRYGVRVIGIELNPDRVAGATKLTTLVGLQDRVQMIQSDVCNVPLEEASGNIVVSQEAFLHVPDKAKALSEAYRILKPGGRLAFTDWIMHRPLSAGETDDMWQGIAAQTLQSLNGYRTLLSEIGFTLLAAEDLTESWSEILAGRLAMYQALRKETRRMNKPSGDDAFYQSYAHLVASVRDRVLGGARFTAKKLF